MKNMLLILSLMICNISALIAAPAPAKQEINAILTYVKNHVDQRIMASKVEIYPFPHIIVEDIFPNSFYEKIKQNWPSQSEFVIGKDREIIPLTYGCLEKTGFCFSQKIFWRVFGEVIVNRYIKLKVIEKLQPYFYLKHNMYGFDCENFPIDTFINLRQDCLIQDSSTHSIPPHIENLNVFASIIIYLPPDDKHPDMGMSFFSGTPCENPNSIYQYKDLKFVKKIIYAPNTLICTLQCPGAWTAFDKTGMPDKAYKRKLYVAQIFHSPEFMEKYYKDIYQRSPTDDYFFDHRFLSRENWKDIWSEEDHYK